MEFGSTFTFPIPFTSKLSPTFNFFPLLLFHLLHTLRVHLVVLHPIIKLLYCSSFYVITHNVWCREASYNNFLSIFKFSAACAIAGSAVASGQMTALISGYVLICSPLLITIFAHYFHRTASLQFPSSDISF